MENTIIQVITAIIIIVGIIVIFIRRKKENLIINDMFWVFIAWGFSLACYCFLGIVYKVQLSLSCFIYILCFWGFYYIGKVSYRLLAKKFSKQRIVEKEAKQDFEKKIEFFPFFCIALLSLIMYLVCMFFLNGVLKIGTDRNINTNAYITFFLLVSHVSLIIWLYELLYALLNRKRISIYGIGSAIIYNVPGIVISGRDALMIFIISTLIAVVYSYVHLKKEGKIDKKLQNKIRIVAIAIIAIIVVYLVFLSNNRYGNTQNSAIDLFKWTSGATFPKYMEDMYNNAGGFGKLFLNLVFYYSSQFSKLTLAFENYTGPYQFGFLQLHYISRLFPDGWNIGTKPVQAEIYTIVNNVSLPGMAGFWETVIGYSIYDFGKFGTIIYAFIFGLIVEMLMRQTDRKMDLMALVLRVIICVGLFTTVEISPFYDYFYVFPLMWIIVINLLRRFKK